MVVASQNQQQNEGGCIGSGYLDQGFLPEWLLVPRTSGPIHIHSCMGGAAQRFSRLHLKMLASGALVEFHDRSLLELR